MFCFIITKKKSEFSAFARRKTATAKVILRPGPGIVTINNNRSMAKLSEFYLQYNSQYDKTVKAPLTLLNLESTFNVQVEVKGGGLRSQSEAIKLAISRAVSHISNKCQVSLKVHGLLTYDSRIKERKKYGLRKARKAPQYSKR